MRLLTTPNREIISNIQHVPKEINLSSDKSHFDAILKIDKAAATPFESGIKYIIYI